jgi:hypothetical protein
MAVRRYSLRRLNPFRGVTRVVELAAAGGARAATTDGINWELQVLTERPAGWGSLNRGHTETLYVPYGVWSAAEGCALYPVHPPLQHAVEPLLAALVLPAGGSAAPRDRFECWLLDAANERPLALLAAVASLADMPGHVASRWHAAPDYGREHIEMLERAVARRGGRQAWFERQENGSGRKVGSGGTATGVTEVTPVTAVTLAAAAFPELLLDEAWDDAETSAAVAAYHDWLAPRRLMLPLGAATRARLELAAAAQPDAVAQFFRLYPAVADCSLMNTLRVQARLIQTA